MRVCVINGLSRGACVANLDKKQNLKKKTEFNCINSNENTVSFKSKIRWASGVGSALGTGIGALAGIGLAAITGGLALAPMIGAMVGTIGGGIAGGAIDDNAGRGSNDDDIYSNDLNNYYYP